jgi:hypothetical protein
MQWLMAEELLSCCDRGAIIAFLFQQGNQAFRSLEVHLA